MAYLQETQRPMPSDPADRRRWEEQSRRLAMQEGEHRPYVSARMMEFFAPETIQRVYSGLDLSSNAFKLANEKKAILYDEAPTVAFDGSAADRQALDLDRLWAQSQWRHLVTNACNSSIVRLDWSKEHERETGTGIRYTTVTPDTIVAKAHRSRPDVPVRVEHLMSREDPFTGDAAYVWEIWDVSNPEFPFFGILSGDRRRNWTSRFLPELALQGYYDGEDQVAAYYPYYDRAARPILPYVLHNLRVGHRLWDPTSRIEIVEGTLTAACLRSWYVSGLRDLAHPQRYGVDVEIPSAVPMRGATEVDRVTLDQSAILMFRSKGTSPQVSQLDPAMDPAVALDSIERYNAALLEGDGLGIEPTNTSRMSGYAIVVSRDSLRRVQRQQSPAARIGDRQILSTAARLLNSYSGTALPEDPRAYSIGYQGVEPSLEEIRSRIERVTALRGARLMTRVDALLTVNPSLTEDDARRKLAEIDAEEEAESDVEEPDPGDVELTDPSTGAPMRTPRGVSAYGGGGSPSRTQTANDGE